MQFRHTMSLLLGLGTLLAASLSVAAPPEQVVRELGLWRQAVASEDPARIAGRMIKGQRIVFKQVGAGDKPSLSLDRDALRQRLVAGQADALGLSRSLLLPRPQDLKPEAEGRWVATDARCPEVRWFFEKHGVRWRLAQVERHLLGC